MLDAGIGNRDDNRFPISVKEEDFQIADLIIAMDQTEHQPMVEQLVPQHQHNVKYFDIGDIHIEQPQSATLRLMQTLDDLIQQLHSEQK